MKGWVGLVGRPVADGLPTLVSPISCRSSAGQGKFAGQRLCHTTNLIVSRQYSKSSETFCKCTVCRLHDPMSTIIGRRLSVSSLLTRFVIAVFTFGPSADNTISLLTGSPLSARASNTGKYRSTNEIQESTGQLQKYRIYRTAGITALCIFNGSLRCWRNWMCYMNGNPSQTANVYNN